MAQQSKYQINFTKTAEERNTLLVFLHRFVRPFIMIAFQKIFLLSLLATATNAFSVAPQIRGSSQMTTTTLHAQDPNMSRRDLSEKITAGILTTATASLLPKEAMADGEEEEGRLIQFEVANLDGIEGNTGTFTIRTKPSWAPKGVQRFEVCLHKLKNCFFCHPTQICNFCISNKANSSLCPLQSQYQPYFSHN